MSQENSSLRALAILNELRARYAGAESSNESPAPAPISELQATPPKTGILVLAIDYKLVLNVETNLLMMVEQPAYQGINTTPFANCTGTPETCGWHGYGNDACTPYDIFDFELDRYVTCPPAPGPTYPRAFQLRKLADTFVRSNQHRELNNREDMLDLLTEFADFVLTSRGN